MENKVDTELPMPRFSLVGQKDGMFEVEMAGPVGSIADMILEAMSQDSRIKMTMLLAVSSYLQEEAKALATLMKKVEEANKDKGYVKN